MNYRIKKNNVQYVNPIEFLNLVYYAEAVVTVSFHGTAFSIIYEKPFFVVNRKESLNSRMIDLLSLLGLDNRLISSFKEYSKEDFRININKCLEKEINKSKQYITMVLKNNTMN